MKILNFPKHFSIEISIRTVAFHLEWIIIHTIVTPRELDDFLKMITYLFPKNTWRKKTFLAVCYSKNNEINLQFLTQFAELGGLIRPGESQMDHFFICSKIFGLHAIFLDAVGFMRSTYIVGPGYVYALSGTPLFANNMLLRHITGLTYWIVLKLKKNSIY